MILEELKDYKRIELVTHPDNKSAIKLYFSFGFLTEKQMENYFGDGEPRILMAKTNN
jgi:ribosomal protein S18 acetylase RimI-like enzyme